MLILHVFIYHILACYTIIIGSCWRSTYLMMVFLWPKTVTGFVKTVPNGTRVEIQFIADY